MYLRHPDAPLSCQRMMHKPNSAKEVQEAAEPQQQARRAGQQGQAVPATPETTAAAARIATTSTGSKGRAWQARQVQVIASPSRLRSQSWRRRGEWPGPNRVRPAWAPLGPKSAASNPRTAQHGQHLLLQLGAAEHLQGEAAA